jgi:hypothetical protein
MSSPRVLTAIAPVSWPRSVDPVYTLLSGHLFSCSVQGGQVDFDLDQFDGAGVSDPESILRGREDNIFWRRVPGRLEAAGGGASSGVRHGA